MTQDPPISFRPGSDRLAAIDAWAVDHGLKRHAAILALIDKALLGDPEPAAEAPHRVLVVGSGLSAAAAVAQAAERVAPKLDTGMVPMLDPVARRQQFVDGQNKKPDRPTRRK